MEKTNKIYLKTKYENGIFVELLDIFKAIPNGKDYQWAVLPVYEPTYIQEKAQNISKKVIQEIATQKLARIDWGKLLILSDGVGQFIDLILIGSKDSKKLKNYEDDREMFKECDVVIIMFDTSWWEIGSKDPNQMNLFLEKFKNEIRTDIN